MRSQFSKFVSFSPSRRWRCQTTRECLPSQMLALGPQGQAAPGFLDRAESSQPGSRLLTPAGSFTASWFTKEVYHQTTVRSIFVDKRSAHRRHLFHELICLPIATVRLSGCRKRTNRRRHYHAWIARHFALKVMGFYQRRAVETPIHNQSGPRLSLSFQCRKPGT